MRENGHVIQIRDVLRDILNIPIHIWKGIQPY